MRQATWFAVCRMVRTISLGIAAIVIAWTFQIF